MSDIKPSVPKKKLHAVHKPKNDGPWSRTFPGTTKKNTGPMIRGSVLKLSTSSSKTMTLPTAYPESEGANA